MTVRIPPSASRPWGVEIDTDVFPLVTLGLPSEAGNEAGRHLDLRLWNLPQRCDYVRHFVALAADSSDSRDRESVAAAILSDVWGPGRTGGPTRLVRPPFSWRKVIRVSGLAEQLGVKRRQLASVDPRQLALVSAREKSKDSAGETREATLLAVESALAEIAPHDSVAELAFRAFAPGLETLAAVPTTDALHQMFAVTIAAHAELKDEIMQKGGNGVIPPLTGTMDDSSYRRRLKGRIRRGAECAGLSADEIEGCRRRAAFLAADFWSSLNSYRMVALSDVVEPAFLPEELNLFTWMHVKPHRIGGGLSLPPICFDPVLASFVPAVSTQLKERLIYVHCFDPGQYPDEWRAGTDRMLAAYLWLYDVTMGGQRTYERTKKGSRSSGLRQGPPRKLEDGPMAFDDRRYQLPPPAHTRPHEGDSLVLVEKVTEQLKKLREALGELHRRGHTSRKIATSRATAIHLINETRHLGLVPAKYLVLQISHKVGRLRQRLVALIFELVLKTSPSTRRLIKRLGVRRGAPPSLVELARELGCSRSNVSRRFIQAETKGLSFLQGMPACADLFRSRIDQLRPSRPRHRER